MEKEMSELDLSKPVQTRDGLVNVPEPKRYVWLNLYRDGEKLAIISSSDSLEEADAKAMLCRVGCIKVELAERFDE